MGFHINAGGKGDKGGRGFGSEKCKGVKEGKVLAVFKTGKQIKEVRSYLIDKTVVKVKEGTQYRSKLRIKRVEKGMTEEEIVTGLYEENRELWEGSECMEGARVLFRPERVKCAG